MSTTVVHKSDRHDVYIGRGTKWGNPYRIGLDGTRSQVIAKYRKLLRRRPDLVEAARLELSGLVLGCHCHPLPCHGDVLARVADGDDP